MHNIFNSDKLNGREHLEVLDVDGENIKGDNTKMHICYKGINWIHLAQDKVRWQYIP
jgi:hypothetical protein